MNRPIETLDGIHVTVKTYDGDGDKIIPDETARVTVVGEEAGVRMILDPYGNDHDVLIEQQRKHWVVYINPAGQDTVFVVKIGDDGETIIEDDMGNVVASKRWKE